MCSAESTLSPHAVIHSTQIAIARMLAEPVEVLERRCLLSSYALQTLATFDHGNGANPQGALIADSNGNVYGTTKGGGLVNAGTVFEVVTGSGSPSTLAAFDDLDGNDPQGTLVTDSSGDLFGTTTSTDGFSNDGTIFEIAAGSGSITDVITFDGADGSTPGTGLILDANGNIFGTAAGGANNDGIVFGIAAGSGTVTTLATFDGTNGENPQGNLTMDSNGDLFGTTTGDTGAGGGGANDGTVYEIVAGSDTVTTLATFDGPNGAFPDGGLIMDSNGNLFGTTSQGGADNDGTVFEVPDGAVGANTLATFNKTNGSSPLSGLVEDSSGDLFGTTKHGGTSNDGAVFEIAAGSSTVTDLLSFNGTDGEEPVGSLITDSNGDLYGTTSSGGGSGDGTVFELVRSNVTVPAAPTDVKATADSIPGGIKITWNGVSNASSYRLFRGTTNKGSAATLIASGIAAKKFTDASPAIVSGADFYYFVEAVNSAGHSSQSTGALGRAAPLPLKINVSETSTKVATGNASTASGNAILGTTATVTNGLNLWFATTTTKIANATESLTSATSNAFAKRGLIVPDGKAIYAATFTEPGDSVSVGLTMNEAAGVLNILDLVLPASALTAFSSLATEMDKIYSTTSLGSAVQSLIKGAGATTTSAVATDAKAIANDAAALFSNSDKQLNVLEADLKLVNVTLTSSELKVLDTPSKIEALSKELIATAQTDTQLKAGKPASVSFTAASA